jgi:hypothetical protein
VIAGVLQLVPVVQRGIAEPVEDSGGVLPQSGRGVAFMSAMPCRRTPASSISTVSKISSPIASIVVCSSGMPPGLAGPWTRVIGPLQFGPGQATCTSPRVTRGARPNRCAARYSYRYFSESASVCSMSAIVSSGNRSWASVTSAEVGWASAGIHCSGFQAPLRSSALGQCG